MNYYISDTHFGWTNKYEDRTSEHDQLIKENWNKIVDNGSHVYILGDLGKEGRNEDNERLCELVSTLKGSKHLIVGNHDKIKDARLKQLFVEICDYKEITDNFNGINHKLILSHYPILFWNQQHNGSIHLFGHVHNTDEYKIYQDCLKYVNEYFKDKEMKGYKDCPQARAFNVGAIVWDYKPVTLKEILSKHTLNMEESHES